MSRMPRSTELPIRRGVLIECNRAAKTSLRFDPQALGDQIGHIRGKMRYEHMHSYALKVFLELHNMDTGKVPQGARVGFRTITELLAIAPQAFRRYCAEQDIEPSLSILNGALHRSTDTPRRLMDLPTGTNTKIELGLGLRNELDKSHLANQAGAFRFEPGEDGLVFAIDDEEFARFGEPDYRRNPYLPDRWQRCPARRLVITRVWPAMVDLATDTPAIFAQDLGIRDTI